MNKELFVESINELQKQFDHDSKFGDILGKAFPGAFSANLVPDNHYIIEQMIKVLKIEMFDNHDHSWIEYFIYELDFGKDYKSGCATFEDGEIIDLSSAESLYNFLKVTISD